MMPIVLVGLFSGFVGFCVGGFLGATMMALANAAKERDAGHDERRPL